MGVLDNSNSKKIEQRLLCETKALRMVDNNPGDENFHCRDLFF